MAAEAEKVTDAVVNDKRSSDDVTTTEHVNDVLTGTDTYPDDQRVKLGWRTWLVVFMMIFGHVPSSDFNFAYPNLYNDSNMTQVFVVTAAGQVIAFIIRDLGNP